jgi:type IV pilus assembly protein PilC
MPNFAYVAKSRSGQEISGFIGASNIDHVIDQLHTRGLIVLNVVEDKAGSRIGNAWKQFATTPLGGTSTRDLALFTRQLSTIIEAGIPLVRGLRGLAADETNRVLSRTVADVSVRVEQGESLADAMAAHPRVFNRMYVSLIRAGERSGTLDEILAQLAVYMEQMDATKTKVRSAMAYPVFVLIFAICVALFLLLKIVPTFEEIYAQMGQQLPALTRTVMTISQAIRTHIILSFGAAVTTVVILYLWTRTGPGRYALHTFFLRMPVFGPIVRKAVLSRFTRTFGILLKSGLPILESLELVKGATGNAVISRAIDNAKSKIGAGQAITPSFRSTRKMPEMVLQLMGTGEESGELDSMLIKISDFYDRQVEAAVHGLSSLIEPLLIVFVGAFVGVIVVTMFLPIFYLGDAIMKGGANM